MFSIVAKLSLHFVQKFQFCLENLFLMGQLAILSLAQSEQGQTPGPDSSGRRNFKFHNCKMADISCPILSYPLKQIATYWANKPVSKKTYSEATVADMIVLKNKKRTQVPVSCCPEVSMRRPVCIDCLLLWKVCPEGKILPCSHGQHYHSAPLIDSDRQTATAYRAPDAPSQYHVFLTME